MLTDHDLFIQLCEKSGILVPIKVSEAIKSSSNTGVLNLSCQSIIVPVCEVLSQVISSSTTITSVNLADCMLLSKSLSCILNAFYDASIVTSLNLKGNNIAGSLVEQLGQLFLRNNTIKDLCLDWNGVGSEPTYFNQFCEGLAKNHSLEKLELRYNQMSPLCASSLSKLLRLNRTLRSLDLAWNTLGLQGGKLMMEGLKENTTLVSLDLKGNCIPNEILQKIEERTYENQRRRSLCEANLGKKLTFKKLDMIHSLSESDSLSQGKKEKKKGFKKIRKRPKVTPLQFSSDDEIENQVLHNETEVRIPSSGLKAEDSMENAGLKSTERKIEELNKIMQERVRAIEILTAELKEKNEENEANKLKINELQGQLETMKTVIEKSKEEKERELEDLKRSYEESFENDRLAHKELQDSFRKLSIVKKDLEMSVRKYEKDMRKSSSDVLTLKRKMNSTTQSYEDLIAKGKTELHRLKREMKEREARLKIEINVLKASLKETTEALEVCQVQLQKSRTELREVSESEVSLKGKLAEAERVVVKCLRFEDALLKVKEEKENLEENYASSQRNVASLQRQLATLQAELIEPQRKYDLLKEELEQEKKRAVKAEAEASEERGRLKDKDEQIKSFTTQISNLNSRILELQESHASELKKKEMEKQQLQECLNQKDRDLNAVKAEEVKRTSHLYAAFSKYFGSIGPNTVS